MSFYLSIIDDNDDTDDDMPKIFDNVDVASYVLCDNDYSDKIKFFDSPEAISKHKKRPM